jgi:hypothetical protein
VATPITISAYLVQAKAQGIGFADILESLKYMALGAIADDQGRVTGTGSDGTSISFSSMDALFAAMNMCRKFTVEDAGPQTLNVEFAPAGSSGSGGGYNS